MKLRQAKKIVRRMKWRSIVHPTDSEAEARRITLRRMPMWKLTSRKPELNTAQGKDWLREVTRRLNAPALKQEAQRAVSDLILYGAVKYRPGAVFVKEAKKS